MWGEKAIPRLIVLLPLLGIMLIGAAAVYFYTKNTHRYFKEQSEQIEREYVASKEMQSREWVSKTQQFFAYNEGALEEKIKTKLRTRIETVHEMAAQIYEKYGRKKTARQQIKSALSRMVWEGEKNMIRITDYEGGNILPGRLGSDKKNIAAYSDADGRAVILEEIQKARRHGAGFVKSRLFEDGTAEITYVKDFGIYGWYFASSIRMEDIRSELKEQMRGLLGAIPAESKALRAVFDKKGAVYLSEGVQTYLDPAALEKLHGALDPGKRWHYFDEQGVRLYAEYFAPFGWYIVHGFETASLDAGIERQRRLINEKMQKDTQKIYVVSALSALFIFIILFFFGWRIRTILADYKEKKA